MSEENSGDKPKTDDDATVEETEAEVTEAEESADTSDAVAESADGDDSAEDEATAAPAPKPKSTPKGGGKGKPKAAAKSAGAADLAHKAHIHSNEATISEIFTGKGDESKPGDPQKSALWEDELENPIKNKTSPMVLGITVVVAIALIGVGFAMLPAGLKTDAINLLKGQDIIEARELRETARIAEERRIALEAAPKFGTVEIVTSPNNLLVTSPGQAGMVFPGTRTDMTFPTRSRVTYQDISVTEDFSFTINGEGNYQDKTFIIPAFGQPNSPWVQSFTGDYSAQLTFMACWPGETPRVEEQFCLYPATDVPWRARELQWRSTWRPDPNTTDPEAIIRLPGTITVSSEPAGALIAFNGRQLVDVEAQAPFVTPHSFMNYPAPPDHEDQTPHEVYLSREGLPLQLLYEGKAATRMGVYMHQFVCNLKEGAVVPDPVPADAPEGTPAEDWLGLCDYTYSINLVLSDPKPPEEGSGSGDGSGDGSGAAAPAAPAAPAEGSAAAAPATP